MDGASNNGTMLATLGDLLGERDICFDKDKNRITCFAHVVNLCSGRVIKDLPGAIVRYEEDDEKPSADTAAQMHGGVRNPVKLARAVVRAIRASTARRDGFQKSIKEGNVNGWFVDANGDVQKLEPLELLRDVRTRWDSVYKMLNRLRVLRPVR